MRSPADLLQRTSDVFIGLLDARLDYCLPDRRVILAGDLPYDGEMFAVWTGVGMYPGFPGTPTAAYQASTGGYTAVSMALNVSVLRKVPNMDNARRLPSAADLSSSALAVLDDGHALGETFYEAYNNHQLASYEDNVALTGVSFFGPSGGIVEARLAFTIQL